MQDITYADPIWRTDSVAAMAEAERRIARAAASEEAPEIILADLTALKKPPKGLGDLDRPFALVLGRSFESGLLSLQFEDWTWLWALSNLQSLSLYRTQIASLAGIKDLTNLQSLTCSGTQITALDGIKDLTNLQSLDCSGTRITALDGIKDLTNLQSLTCSDTQITALDGIKDLTNLQSLTCSDTRITALDGIKDLTNLQSLTCSDTQITALDGIKDLTNLQSLTCSDTRITALDGIKDLTNLQSLTCSDTRITSLGGIKDLTNLQSLTCRFTRITALDGIKDLTNLQSLDCSGTKITALDGIKDLTNLQSLDCGYTQITALDGIKDLTNLQSLDCSFTRITALDGIKDLTNLQSLTCRHTKITALDGIKDLTNLQSLDCGYTQITALDGIKDLTNLQSLTCSDTQITALDGIKDLTNLQSLDCGYTQIASLAGIKDLTNLQSLTCSGTQITALDGIKDLTNLQSLTCSGTKITALDGIKDLTNLQSLTCSGTKITALDGIKDLTNLQNLDCSGTKITALDGIKDLTNLQSLDCGYTQITALDGIKDLTNLQSLNCRHTKITALDGIKDLTNLQSLTCSDTRITALDGIKDLTNLQSLDCGYTQITALDGIKDLTNLQSLTCRHTQITALDGVKDLTNLQSLTCSDTRITALDGIKDLTNLQSLDCSFTRIDAFSQLRAFVLGDVGHRLIAQNVRVAGLPDELFSQSYNDDCAARVRAHFLDLGADPEPLNIVKLIVLGNGRIGKTQICNRLRGIKFKTDADSTHGIQVEDAPIPDREGRFRIWDFGGQEIYHGTHALFMRSRAVFLLVWTPETDNSDEDIPAFGMQFRNRPVRWWLDFVRRFGDKDSPIVMVQNQLDLDGARDLGDHEDFAPLRAEYDYCRALAMSAKTKEGLASLREGLRYASEAFNPPLIGKGRLLVMEKLREMLAQDHARARDDRQFRTLSMQDFRALCDATGGISDPEQFLAFLHNAGEVFWNKSSQDHEIILDQGWALEAVYALYDRKTCWRHLVGNNGRFYRALLGAFLWDKEGYSEEEQTLFLQFMEQSEICFSLPAGPGDTEKFYIAPDALPETPDASLRHAPQYTDAQHTYEFDQIPPGFLRTLLVRIGQKAGWNGIYWRTGFSGYDGETRSHIRIEATLTQEEQPDSLVLSASGGGAQKLIGAMGKLCEEVMQIFRMEPDDSAPNQREKQQAMTDFRPDPEKPASFFVSYAWGDTENPDRAKIVDDFCDRAEAEGIHIRRDKDELTFGDSISEFMGKLAEGDRILIVLSAKYLRSIFCMSELYQIWHNAGHDREQFRSKVRLFTAHDAGIRDTIGRAQIAKYWNDQYELQTPMLTYMGDKDRVAHNQLKRFYTHVPDILELVTDTLQPRNLDDLVSYALD